MVKVVAPLAHSCPECSKSIESDEVDKGGRINLLVHRLLQHGEGRSINDPYVRDIRQKLIEEARKIK